MNKIYIVFECDGHRTHTSTVIKFITTSLKKAEVLYKHAGKYYTDNQYFLNLAIYEPVLKLDGGNNILNELSILKTTEDNG